MARRSEGLKSDATIVDVIPTLQNPDEYVRVVLLNMFVCKQKHGNAFVRIGITGTGQVPYHRITFKTPEGHETLFAAFDGKHPFKDVSTQDSNWSSATLTLEEVQKIRGDLRGWVAKSRPA